jgi:hypothetical protein
VNSAVANKLYSALKSEFSCYYSAFFSRKAAPPICIALCSIIIIGYVIGNVGRLS